METSGLHPIGKYLFVPKKITRSEKEVLKDNFETAKISKVDYF